MDEYSWAFLQRLLLLGHPAETQKPVKYHAELTLWYSRRVPRGTPRRPPPQRLVACLCHSLALTASQEEAE